MLLLAATLIGTSIRTTDSRDNVLAVFSAETESFWISPRAPCGVGFHGHEHSLTTLYHS
jgi:hypothetical protein